MSTLKKKQIFITLFLLGFGIILLGQAILASQNIRSFFTQAISFEVDPPSQALGGSISSLSGDVRKLSRTALDFEAAKLGDKVLHGESIAAGEDGAVTIIFDQFAQAKVGNNSRITFVTTIPTQFSIRQTQGQVSYQSKGGQEFSIRSQHLLLAFNGLVDVAADDEEGRISINLLEGKGNITMGSWARLSTDDLQFLQFSSKLDTLLALATAPEPGIVGEEGLSESVCHS